MTIKISGILKDGMGRPIPKCTIELISKKTTLNVITKTEANLLIDSAGSYSMNVEPSEYSVSLYIEGFSPKYVGTIRVYADSRPGTLNDFLMLPGESDLSPELVLMFQQLRDEAKQAAELSELSKTDAEKARDNVLVIQSDITEKQLQVNVDAGQVAEDRSSATVSAQEAKENAEKIKGDALLVSSLKDETKLFARNAEDSAERAEAVAAEAKNSSVAAGNSESLAKQSAENALSDKLSVSNMHDDVSEKATQVASNTQQALAAQGAAVTSAEQAFISKESAKADAEKVELIKSNAADALVSVTRLHGETKNFRDSCEVFAQRAENSAAAVDIETINNIRIMATEAYNKSSLLEAGGHFDVSRSATKIDIPSLSSFPLVPIISSGNSHIMMFDIEADGDLFNVSFQCILPKELSSNNQLYFFVSDDSGNVISSNFSQAINNTHNILDNVVTTRVKNYRDGESRSYYLNLRYHAPAITLGKEYFFTVKMTANTLYLERDNTLQIKLIEASRVVSVMLLGNTGSIPVTPPDIDPEPAFPIL